MSGTKAPVFAVSRHRLGTDSAGVTTLVGFRGCPLGCRYCLNPECVSDGVKTLYLTPEELYNRVKQDRLYFLATGGGVTFGGGEPLLYPGFIAEFRNICGGEWKICAETSLAVPAENVKRAAGVIDRFFVDCKDTDPVIYKSYTGKSSDTMTENLKMLVSLVSPDRITARLPLIPGFNSEGDVDASEKFLLSLGITDIDRFTYTVKQ